MPTATHVIRACATTEPAAAFPWRLRTRIAILTDSKPVLSPRDAGGPALRKTAKVGISVAVREEGTGHYQG